MFQSIGLTEWLLIILVVLVIFGGKKLPELFKGLGDAIKEFKRAAKGQPEDKKG